MYSKALRKNCLSPWLRQRDIHMKTSRTRLVISHHQQELTHNLGDGSVHKVFSAFAEGPHRSQMKGHMSVIPVLGLGKGAVGPRCFQATQPSHEGNSRVNGDLVSQSKGTRLGKPARCQPPSHTPTWVCTPAHTHIHTHLKLKTLK